MITWIRVALTCLLGVVALLLQFGVTNTWTSFFTWHSGPVALPSITYHLAEPYRTIALALAMALIILVWLPRLVGKSSQGKKAKIELSI